ncbi:MAG: primosomal protein N' [Clostridiales Family XIII bacterium]|jgi:primosomal protein N' (replication factor Y)|nr:primosomal protein N' [Clostridiales Family XIII bacterium]
MKYVDVIVDNNTDNTDAFYTYGCEFDEVAAGNRVFVPFTRNNREKAAFVAAVRDEQETAVKGLKYVERMDAEWSLDADSMEICIWMKKRYYCRYIEAVRCFLPAGSASKRGKQRKPAFEEIPEERPSALTGEQDAAMKRIAPWIEENRHRTFLIHGVTGSGKTEIYLRSAALALEQGKKAMILVPEISLTPQTIGRFIARFGQDDVAVLHSRLSSGERYDEWMRVKKEEARIVIGARSAVFAPCGNIGLIVIDEEHEATYKSDKSPKYDTVEVAIKRARQNGATVLLGSATPSLVSSFRVETRLYERISLRERFNKNPLPAVRVVDMREELQMGNKTIFSAALYRAVAENLGAGRQVILFLNRRGHSTFISCRSCGYVMKCGDCGISLTYHKTGDEARCHMCGARRGIPDLCPECQSKYLKFFGAGTEKVEETARELFPDASMERLDLDTARKKGSMDAILARFRKGKTQILIGTQLVAKGLDFSNVGLVGIVSADVTLNIPDFRSSERAFQLITQAAGRAGRGDKTGAVIIQSYKPDHYAVRSAAKHDYAEFYGTELLVRKAMEYPPFCDLVQITVSAEDEQAAAERAEALAVSLRGRVEAAQGNRVLGPGRAQIYKSGALFRYQICVKVAHGDREAFESFLSGQKKAAGEGGKKCGVTADVNPHSFM